MTIALAVLAALAILVGTPLLTIAAYIALAHRRARSTPNFPFMLRTRRNDEA